MKVAVCLSGHFRSFNRTYNSIINNLIAPNLADVFIAAWMDNLGNWLPRTATPDPRNHPGFRLDSPAITSDYLNEVLKILQPKAIHLDNYFLHDQKFQDMLLQYKDWHHPELTHAPKSTLSMNWIRQISIKLKKQYEQQHNFKYDYVVYTRFDIEHNSKIDLTLFDPNIITCCKGGADWHPGDIWFGGSSALMDIAGNQFDSIDELVKAKTFNFGPHEWQTSYFKHNKIPWINNTNLDVKFLR